MRDELLRRLSLRQRISAFHPEASQQIMDLENPLLGILRGNGESSVRIIVNLGFAQSKCDLSEPSFDLLSGREIHGEFLVAPGEVLWLSTTDARS